MKISSPCRTLLCTLTVLLNSACAGAPQCKRWYPLIFKGDEARRLELRGYDLATQYEVYICAMNHLEPPKLVMSRDIAMNGIGAIEFLEGKLRDGKADWEIFDVVSVLFQMKADGYYDVAVNQTLMLDMQRKIEGMSEGIYKIRAQDLLQRIQRKAISPK